MIEKTKLATSKMLNNKFISGSLVMLIGTNLYNFSQLLYHFLAGRFLGKAIYGDLATIISILGFFAIIQLAFNLTIVKFIASEKNDHATSGFIRWVYKWSLIIGFVLMLSIVTLAQPIKSFLQISDISYVILLGPLLLFFIVTLSGRSILQGLLKFDQYIYSLLAEAFVKIILALMFFLLGYALFGAIGAFLIGVIISFIITSLMLKQYLLAPVNISPNIWPLLKFSGAVLVQGVALTSMYTTDLLIIKHFLSAEVAGLYAALAILGRVVFFGASPITNVMFPIIAKKHLSGEKYYGILGLSVILVLGFSLVITSLYWLFPTVPLGFLYGEHYLEGAPLLWLFGVFMSLLSVAVLLTQFFLSINETKPVYIFALAALLQALLVWFNHDSLFVVVQMSIISAALLVLSLFVYFFYSSYLNQKIHKK